MNAMLLEPLERCRELSALIFDQQMQQDVKLARLAVAAKYLEESLEYLHEMTTGCTLSNSEPK